MMTRQCVLSEEDSVSQKDDVTVSASATHHFYDLVCLDNRKYSSNLLGIINTKLTTLTWRQLLFVCSSVDFIILEQKCS